MPYQYNKFLHHHEVLIAVVPKAWLAYAGRAAGTVIIAFFTAFFSTPLLQGGVFLQEGFAALCLVTLWLGIGLWIRYVYNVLLITDTRVIDVGQGGVFRRTVLDMSYDHITDTSWDRAGVWENVFRVGGINLHALGSDRAISLRPVRNPQRIQGIIREVISLSQAL